jgi:VCBS repeat-containing protein
VTITINSVNDPPVASNDTASTRQDQLLVVPAPGVLANDSDADFGDTKTVVAVNGIAGAVGSPFTLPSGAIVNLRADGSYWYDPNGKFDALGVGQTAVDSFTYTMRDQAGATSTAQVTVTITRALPANSIGGSVYADVNNDGIRQPYEMGLPQVLVRLEGPVVRSIRTDANGYYRFDNLPDGTYTLWEYHPQSFLDGKETQGTPVLGTVGNDRFVGLPLVGGVQATGYNFGERGLKSPDKSLELASTNFQEVLLAIMATDEPPGLEAQLDQQLGIGLVGFRNLRNPLDVSDDDTISPIDALLVINVLNNPRMLAERKASTIGEGMASGPYYDTSGDGVISPIDALLVINYLNEKSRVLASQTGGAGEGEADGEAAVSAAFDRDLSGATDGSEMDDLLALLAEDLVLERRKRL